MKRHTLILSLAAAGLLASSVATAQTHYLFVPGGREVAATAPGITVDDDVHNDINFRNVLVADIDVNAKSVTNWRRAGDLPTEHPDVVGSELQWLYIHDAVNVYNNRLYVGPATFAGDNAVTTNFVAYADINGDGSLGTFEVSQRFPEPPENQRIAATEIVEVGANTYFYIIGGNATPAVTDRILYATVDQSTGALGTWITASVALPVAEWFHSATAVGNTLLVSDGNLNTSAAQVWTTTLDSNGNITTAFAANNYTAAYTTRWDQVTLQASSGGNDYVYMVAGTASGPGVLTEINVASAGNLTSWSASTTPLPAPRRRMAGAAVADMIVIPGGSTSGGFADGVDTVFVGTVNSDGTITWKDDTDASVDTMIQNRSFHGAAIAPAVTTIQDWVQY